MCTNRCWEVIGTHIRANDTWTAVCARLCRGAHATVERIRRHHLAHLEPVAELERRLRASPFAAPERDDLQALGLGASSPPPFTLSQARQAIGTTRRVAVPLLQHLDGRGWTHRVDGQREIVR